MSDFPEELVLIRRAAPQEITIVHPRKIICDFQPTRMKRIRLSVLYLDTYPQSKPVIHLESRVISEVALAEIKTHLSQGMRKVSDNAALYAVTKVREMMMSHRFLPCWDELAQVKRLIGSSKVKTNALKGTVRVKLKAGQYIATLTATVAHDYPDSVLQFSLTGCNLDPRLSTAIIQKAERLVVKLYQGVDVKTALTFHDRSEIANLSSNFDARPVVLTNDTLRSATDAVKYLQKASDLQQHRTNDAKVRRTLVRMTKKAQKEHEETDRKELQDKQQELLEANAKLMGHGTGDCLPSLLHLCEFFKNRLASLPLVRGLFIPFHMLFQLSRRTAKSAIVCCCLPTHRNCLT
jgi:hypothetical protein